jgi:DNA gyrase subunit A
MVGALQALPDDQVMLISSSGVLVRTPAEGISLLSRNTQGVRLIRLDEGDRLVGMERVAAEQAEEEGDHDVEES